MLFQQDWTFAEGAAVENSLRIQLEPRGISTCPNPALPLLLKAAFPQGMLQHQVDLYKAAEANDIVLDTAPTGTGKTKAGLSVIHLNPTRNAIYIAPTNALIEQQTEAAREFVETTGLPHIVKAASAQRIREWPIDRVGKRPGEKIYNALREPATIFPACGGNRPLLLVTNPDIFYYAAFFQYGDKDKNNIASEFYSGFSTIIFDEFHLYDAKQLVSLLFYLTLSKIFGYFDQNRKIVLLTATPEPACEAALGVLQSAGTKVKSIDGQGREHPEIPSQTAVNLELRKYLEKESLINEITAEVIDRLKNQPDKYGAVILDSKDTLNRIAEQLQARGYESLRRRITGNTPQDQRHIAAQKQVILATSTVDVGFNFEREISPDRQNLDWLIFSSRDRFSFWQRLGRVGRVLGKSQTELSSDAIAYLPEKAWEEGIESLDTQGGRVSLQIALEALDCMKKPFLDIYWKSEAFLEIARPLLELESALQNLEQAHLIDDLYQTLQTLFKGRRTWKFYKHRMRLITFAEQLSKQPITPTREGQWSFTTVLFKGPDYIRRSFIEQFMDVHYPEELEALKSGDLRIEEIEAHLKKNDDFADELREFSVFWKTVWSPIFRFRDSLLPGLAIHDPKKFLLDEVGETNLDPFHLLRFYEFVSDGNQIEVTDRVEETFQLSFRLAVDDIDRFEATKLAKLWAFKDMSIRRSVGNTARPTKLPDSLEKAFQDSMIPGVVIKEHRTNRWAIIKLKKLGLDCYPILVSSPDHVKDKEFLFFPSLSGILAIASAGIALKSPDNEEFWVV